MPNYTVTWVIDLEVDTPQEAAEQSLAIMLDPDSAAQYFTVEDEETKEVTNVDLYEERIHKLLSLERSS